MIRKLNFSDLDIKLSINEQRNLKNIQRRAYESLEFGLSVKDSYYNIFISAPNWLEIEEQVLKIVEEFKNKKHQEPFLSQSPFSFHLQREA